MKIFLKDNLLHSSNFLNFYQYMFAALLLFTDILCFFYIVLSANFMNHSHKHGNTVKSIHSLVTYDFCISEILGHFFSLIWANVREAAL